MHLKKIKIGEFLCSIFVLKMEVKSNVLSILCFIISRKIKTQLKCKKKKICAVHREGAMTDQSYQKWSVKFQAGAFSMDGAPQSGRSVEADVNQNEALTETNKC